MTTIWNNCYDEGWGDMIVKEAYAHPAKYAHGLICRIIETGLERGYWSSGSLIGDCFGGIASGGIVAGYHGLNWIGVELEKTFVFLGNRNLALHENRHRACGAACRLVQGDSRRFSEFVKCIVTSPPFSEPNNQPNKVLGGSQVVRKDYPTGQSPNSGYGTTPGAIGELPTGQFDSIVTSPPYAESVHGDHAETETANESRDKRRTAGGSLGQSARHGGYGVSEGQIGALREAALTAVVTSPPFEDCEPTRDDNFRYDGKPLESTGKHYGQSACQLGNESGQTYWSEIRKIYLQCHLALKAHGYMAVVIKNYISKGKVVPLCDQTAALLESCGFDVFERVHAMQVKEHSHPSLFGGHETKTTQRKSFFRRLAEKKGSPPIDFEEVLWCRNRDLT